MNHKKYLFVFLACLSFGFAANQITSLDELLNSFEKFDEDYVQEKVYLHTDKPYYVGGEDIWFKAYVLNAKNLRFSPKSNLLYVELTNQKSKVIKRIKIAMVAGTGWGNFSLPDTLKEGNYRIRAYTNWMRNFDSGFYYDHIFKVGDVRTNQMVVNTKYSFTSTGDQEQVNASINYKNIDGVPYADKEVAYQIELDGKNLARGKTQTDNNGNIELKFNQPKRGQETPGLITTSVKIAERTVVDKFIPITSTSNNISLQFFPEGGDLVSGLRSKVGFKALKADGLGVNVNGHIEDETGQPLALLKSKYKGIGAFNLVPIEGKKYFGVLKFDDGTERRYPLPEVKSEGLVLNVLQRSGDSVYVRVLVNENYINANNGKDINLVAQSSGHLLYSAKAKITNAGGFVVKFSLRDFPMGIAQLTLFNDLMQPMAERLFFVKKDDQMRLDLKGLKATYKAREKVNLELSAGVPKGDKVVGSFSVAVIDETKVPVKEEEEHTILSEILLNSDLRGNIESPNYYFLNQDAEKLEQLDNLLLTQGWRRFKWTDILNRNYPQIKYHEERNLTLRGRVMNNKKLVPNATIIAFAAKSLGIFQVTANEKGEFLIDSLYFPDSTKFVIQARSEKGKKYVEIVMDDNIDDEVIPKMTVNDLSVNISSSMLAYLKSSKTQYEELLKYGLTNRTIMLDEIRVVEKKREVENSSNLNGGGNADRIVKGEDLENAPTLEFALQGKVAGLMFQNGEAYFTRNNGTPAQIILDGMYVEPDMLNAINPSDVESVEILKSIAYTAIYGSRGGGGVIVINTKRGGGGGFSNTYSPGIISYAPLGLFVAKEFYSPDYEKPEQSSSMSDYRSTVYWNPRVITDSTGTAKIAFFNSDGRGKYRIVVEGADLKGHIGRKVIRYGVN